MKPLTVRITRRQRRPRRGGLPLPAERSELTDPIACLFVLGVLGLLLLAGAALLYSCEGPGRPVPVVLEK